MERDLSEANSSEFDVGGDREDEIFDVLSNSRRRFVLASLEGVEIPVSVEELTREVVAWEAQRSVPGRSDADRNAIEISLMHNHLPKMAEAGLIRYDDTRRTVALVNQNDEVRAHLQPLASD